MNNNKLLEMLVTAEKMGALKDPVIERIFMGLFLDEEDKELAEVLQERLEPYIIREVISPDPFRPYPGDAEVAGDIEIGKVPETAASFGLNLDEFCRHVLVVGETGAGKSNLMYIILRQLL